MVPDSFIHLLPTSTFNFLSLAFLSPQLFFIAYSFFSSSFHSLYSVLKKLTIVGYIPSK